MSGHVPVMLSEVLELLAPEPGDRVLDATLGCGGHAREMANRIGRRGILVGIDRDDRAIERAKQALADAEADVHLRRANFSELDEALEDCEQDEIDVALFDLGMSSIQVDDPSRGFSFKSDGPLDMRMDDREAVSAEDVVNDTPEKELADLIYQLGEERESRRIARAVVQARSFERIKTTLRLAKLVEKAKRQRRGRIHPATKVFQALRMAVNEEVESLTSALESAWNRLAPGGRMATISFHSIEDRIVKNVFRDKARSGQAKLVVKKPVRPSEEECESNPRSRSAKLRVLRKNPLVDEQNPEGSPAS